MKIISLGWGVQSFALAAMSALGDLPPVDAAVHADTGHESSGTYAFAEKWTAWLGERGVKVVTVQGGRAIGTPYGVVEAVNGEGNGIGVMIPAYTDSGKGKAGSLRRQCTNEWKIAPIRRYLQAHRNGEPVEMWLGISLDEIQRMKPADVQYIENRWPLVEKHMTRADCVKWLQDHGLEIPPKSACVFCPYHSAKEWRRVRESPEDWQHAVEIDEQIRTMRPSYPLYLHRSLRPLNEIDFRSEEEKGQLSLWDNECEGYCGL